MTSFISKSACRGRRPASLIGFSGRQRPQLVAHLLRERNVARFVVAPCGYGKTSVAVEYAETIFSWAHVFWINCQSPCFVRDLDASCVARCCLLSDQSAQLVVFDNLPALDQARAEQLSKEIDALLEEGCEVLATCSPTSDAYGLLQRDRLLLSARDLLLNDEELDLLRSMSDRGEQPACDITAAHRVPALVWGDESLAKAAFLQATFSAEVPADLALALATMHVLTRGPLDGLLSFGIQSTQALEDFLALYPHLCANFETGQFDSTPFDAADIARAVKRRIDDLVKQSRFSSKCELAYAWADSLIDRARASERACDIVREFCTAKERLAWFARRAADLIRLGSFYGCHNLIESVRPSLAKEPVSMQVRAAAVDAICLHMLGDADSALRRAKRYGFVSTTAHEAQMCCLLLLVRFGGGIARQNAEDTLRAFAERSGAPDGETPLVEWAARAQVAAADGIEQLCSFWKKQRSAGANADALNLTASWALDAYSALPSHEAILASSRVGKSIREIEQHVKGELDGSDDPGGNLFAWLAGFALQHAHALKAITDTPPLPAACTLKLRNAEMSIATQRNMFERDERNKSVLRSNWADTHPDSLALGHAKQAVATARRNVPILTVRLFGKFEASIGNDPINPLLFKRQNVSTLLALLAYYRNREVMRETLAQSMWPKSNSDLAVRNFYTVWSQLRKALELDDGTCPYLVRHQFGCSLDAQFVQSDIERFNEICHELLFGTPDFLEWPVMYSEIKRDFSGDLMPSDKSNPLLETIRNECSMRLIEALLSATQAIVDAGSPQWGIWFAREAVARDRTREDAYVSLMRAQIAANQRTAAMMTYIKCQQVLSEELGIDPSSGATSLYNGLLDDL